MALGVDSASNRNEYQEHFLRDKGGRCVRLTTLPPSCAVVMKSGNLNFLEPSGQLQACNGTALPFDYTNQTEVHLCCVSHKGVICPTFTCQEIRRGTVTTARNGPRNIQSNYKRSHFSDCDLSINRLYFTVFQTSSGYTDLYLHASAPRTRTHTHTSLSSMLIKSTDLRTEFSG